MARTALFILPAAAMTACSDPNGLRVADESDQDTNVSVRIKDQVLDILCDGEVRNIQEDLVPVVKYARQRDGRSDRVWEVADQADCSEARSNPSP